MNLSWIALAASLVLVAGCDSGPEPRSATQTGSSATPPAQSGSSASGGASTTTTTPANIGQPPSTAERKDGANPAQGQVDPKQSEQRRDFQQPGDARGPSSPDTQPKPGG